MTVKFTMSRDGTPRATVRVEYRLSADDFAAAVAECLDDDLPVTRANVEAKARELLRIGGADGLHFFFDRTEQNLDECQAEARRIFSASG